MANDVSIFARALSTAEIRALAGVDPEPPSESKPEFNTKSSPIQQYWSEPEPRPDLVPVDQPASIAPSRYGTKPEGQAESNPAFKRIPNPVAKTEPGPESGQESGPTWQSGPAPGMQSVVQPESVVPADSEVGAQPGSLPAVPSDAMVSVLPESVLVVQPDSLPMVPPESVVVVQPESGVVAAPDSITSLAIPPERPATEPAVALEPKPEPKWPPSPPSIEADPLAGPGALEKTEAVVKPGSVGDAVPIPKRPLAARPPATTWHIPAITR